MAQSVVMQQESVVSLRGGALAVSIREAAVMLGVSERTVRNMTKKGELPSRKIGTRVVFSIEAIKAFLADTSGSPGQTNARKEAHDE